MLERIEQLIRRFEAGTIERDQLWPRRHRNVQLWLLAGLVIGSTWPADGWLVRPATAPAISAFAQIAETAQMNPPTVPAPILPGRGLAQHPFLYCGEWDKRKPVQTMYVVRNGKVVWSYFVPLEEELSDCTRLSNGNIIFAHRLGASEITPDKRIVWHHQAPPNTEIHTAQPIGKDRVLLMQNGNPAKILLINKVTGKAEKELIVPTASGWVHGQVRHIRMTKVGTFLVAHMDSNKVVEYDGDGEVIWSVPAPSPWAAIRLQNGNTLISGNQHGFVREVNSKGETVWEINKNDLPGIPLYIVQEVQRLANGNTLINNWSGGLKQVDWPGVVQLIEVTPDKKVVWALRDWTNLGPASSTQLLDEPGVPENGDLQR